MKTLRCFLGMAILALASASQAAVPATTDFQGFVRDSGNGQPYTGQHVVTTSLFGDITGGSAIWTEADTLSFDGGVFTTRLGDVNPLTAEIFQDSTLFLEVLVDGNISGSRTQLVSVPFAFQAQMADSAGFASRAAVADSAAKGTDGHWTANGNHIYNTNTGNIGVGTNNPQIKIDVENGDIGVHKEGMAALFAADQYGGNLWSNDNYDRAHPGDGWLRTMTWKDGNIGFGTNAPQYKFHFNGGTTAWPFCLSGSSSLMLITGEGNIPADTRIFQASNAVGSELCVLGNGNVGVGTIHPPAKLSIVGGYRTTGLSNEQGIHLASIGASPDMGQLWWGDGSGWKFHMGTRDGNGNFLPRFTFQDWGRMGIGTTSPLYPLDVNGIINSSSGGFRFPDGTIQSTAAGSGLWSANGNSIYYNNGNVGVGTSSPGSRFTVQSPQLTDRGLRVSDGTTNSNIVLQPLPGENSGFQAINFNGYFDGSEVRLNTAKNRWRFGADQRGSSDVFFLDTQSATGGTEVLTALTDGRVGIGTTTPDSRLHVESGVGHAIHAISNYGVDNYTGALIESHPTTGNVFGLKATSVSDGKSSTDGGDPPHSSGSAAAVYGQSTRTGDIGDVFGVLGEINGAGGSGLAPNAAAGVYGVSYSATGLSFGVFGETHSNQTNIAGVYGISNSTGGRGHGVLGITESPVFHSCGVYGKAVANSGETIGVYGRSESPSGYAGWFDGNVNITGTLSKGGGSFKIDHPLDPANKYLYHSFVESPDMKNIYDGVATLDSEGSAWVEMPEWFEALNRDFRYQLTPIGASAPNLYVATTVTGNRFRIAGGQASQQVSWQVTGIRHDTFANAHRIPVEEAKSVSERGTYLYPEATGMASSHK